MLIGATVTVTFISFALISRPLIASSIDPTFYEIQSKRPALVTQWFTLLVVLNLLGAFKVISPKLFVHSRF